MTDRITVDRDAKMTADSAWMSDQPHPGGYVLTSSLRLRRALWAYQWALRAVAENPDSWMWPSNSEMLAALRQWERETDGGGAVTDGE